MRSALCHAIAVAVIVLGTVSPSFGFEGYLLVEGLRGDSQDPRHKDWINVVAVGWGHQMMATSADPRIAVRSQFQPLTVTKFLDASSPMLAQMLAAGQHIRKIVLELVPQPGFPPFAKIELDDALVSSYAVEGVAAPQSRPTEKIAFNFSAVKWTVAPMDAQGKPGPEVRTGWDLSKNTMKQ